MSPKILDSYQRMIAAWLYKKPEPISQAPAFLNRFGSNVLNR